jgi:hypothetical protein
METKYGFTKMSLAEFEAWLPTKKVARTIITLQQHHTWSPNYFLFNGSNHFDLQRSMKNHHVHSNGWMDIGQHFTSFPDGSIVTGRSLENSPACILGFNSNSLCIEHLGNFDEGKDDMTAEQRGTIIKMSALICQKFGIAIHTDKVVYHHWFNLSTGARNNGTGNNKTCPGTAFFGGNKVHHAEANFIPLVKAALQTPVPIPPDALVKYVSVTATTLNIRTKPNADSPKVPNRPPASFGAVLRVFKIKDDWYKISSDSQHWVSAKHTTDVQRATVQVDDSLNVRNGPGKQFAKLETLTTNDVVFVYEDKDGWCRISVEERWVNKSFLQF